MNLGGIKATGFEEQMVSTDILLLLALIGAVILIVCICLFARAVVTRRLKACNRYKQAAIAAHKAVIHNIEQQWNFSENKNKPNFENCPINFDEYDKLLVGANINTATMDEKTRQRYMAILTDYPKVRETVHVEIGNIKTELIHLSESGGFLINFFVWMKRKEFLSYKEMVDNIGETPEDIKLKEERADNEIKDDTDSSQSEKDEKNNGVIKAGTSIEAELARLQKENGHGDKR